MPAKSNRTAFYIQFWTPKSDPESSSPLYWDGPEEGGAFKSLDDALRAAGRLEDKRPDAFNIDIHSYEERWEPYEEYPEHGRWQIIEGTMKLYDRRGAVVWSESSGTASPSAHPIILKQYPLGQVPKKMPIDLDIPIPPLRGTVSSMIKVTVPENAALRTNEDLDRAVEHLGYQSVSLSEEEVAGLEKPIPTDVDLINESQRRLRRLKVIPDGQLNARQLAHLNLARVLAQTICYRNPVSGVYAASIPPASDRVRTVGTYGTKNKAGYIALDALDTGRITIDTLIHELGHHQQYLKMGEAEDLEIEHAEAMTSIAGETVAIVGTGKLDKLLVDVAW